MSFRSLSHIVILVGLVLAGMAVADAAEPSPFGHAPASEAISSQPTPQPPRDSGQVRAASYEAPAAPGSVADPDDSRMQNFEARLEAMEAAWNDYQDARELEQQEAASKPTFQIHGRIHADFWGYPFNTEGIGFFEHPDPTQPDFGTDPEDFFAFRRVRLEMQGEILEPMLWRIQIDFNNPSAPEFKDVYIGFKELPDNQRLLIGIQKRPLGLDHLNSSRFNVFMERPLVVEAFNEDARRPGIAMYGYTDDESIGWAYGTYLLKNVTLDGRYRADAMQASLNGRLWGSPWYDDGGREYFHWALSGMVAHPDGQANDRGSNVNEARFRTRPEARSVSRWLNTGRIPEAQYYEVLGLESIVNVGPWQFVAEAQTNWLQRHHISPEPDLFFYGAYAYVSYFLTGEHIPYSRKTGTIGRVVPFENFSPCCGTGHGWGAWNVALRYDFLSLTSGDITGGVEQAGTLALNWHFTPYSKLQFNLIYGSINKRGPIGGFDSGRYLIAGTRFAIEF